VQPSDKGRAVVHAARQLEGAQEVAAAAELVHLQRPIDETCFCLTLIALIHCARAASARACLAIGTG